MLIAIIRDRCFAKSKAAGPIAGSPTPERPSMA
jgi:hypothetical protein